MAGEQKRKQRNVLITKALLLGYTIKWDAKYEVFLLYGSDCKLIGKRFDNTTWRLEVLSFPAPWLAARCALILAGVIDADPRRDTGVGSGKARRLYKRRRQRGRTASLFKGS